MRFPSDVPTVSNDDFKQQRNDDRARQRACKAERDHKHAFRVGAALDAMRRGDHVAAGWYFYGVGPSGTRPKDCK